MYFPLSGNEEQRVLKEKGNVENCLNLGKSMGRRTHKVSKVVESKMSIFCFMIFTSMYSAYEVSDVCVFNKSSHLGSMKTYMPAYVYQLNANNTKKTAKVIETAVSSSNGLFSTLI